MSGNAKVERELRSIGDILASFGSTLVVEMRDVRDSFRCSRLRISLFKEGVSLRMVRRSTLKCIGIQDLGNIDDGAYCFVAFGQDLESVLRRLNGTSCRFISLYQGEHRSVRLFGGYGCGLLDRMAYTLFRFRSTLMSRLGARITGYRLSLLA